MEFLVQMELTAWIETGNELLAKEAERAHQLAEAGILRRLWRVPGRRANWGLWVASSIDELHAVLASLPLFPHLNITVHPLASHPNDPHRITQQV